ncbi:MAG: hypothetical protein ACYC6Y_21310, partial [Thermoguttaceae bacterium]
QDRTVLQVERVRAERSLLYLLLNSSDVGPIHIEKPVLSIAWDGTGTNVEQVFAGWLGSTSFKDGFSAELAVSGGTMVLTDVRSSRNWQVNEFDMTAALPRDQRSPVDLRASGRIADADDAGRFALKLVLGRDPARASLLASIQTLEAELENTPLEIFAPILARSLPGTELGGSLHAFAKCEVSGGSIQPEMAIQLTAKVDKFLLAGAAVHGDRLAIDKIDAGARGSWRGAQLDIERLRVETELGNALVSGTFNVDGKSFTNLLTSLAQQSCRVEAGVNVATLASRLPNTLRLQEGLRIDSGNATLLLESRRAGDTMRWDGRAEVSRLSAQRQERRINWPEPILATFSASSNAQGLSIERLECQAKDLHLNASGTPEQIDGSLDFDLARLAAEASQLIDLGDVTMSGTGHGTFKWRRQTDRNYAADAELQVDQFQLADGDQPGLSDPSLTLRGAAQGAIGNSGPTTARSANLDLQIGDDRLTLTLAEPLADVARAASYPLTLEARGDLARWSARLRPVVPLESWQAGGRIDGSARVDYAPETIVLRNARFRLDDFSLRGPGTNFSDPQLELVAPTATWFRKQNRVEIPSATASGKTVGAGVEPLAVGWSAGSLNQLDGSAALRTTLDRVQQWTDAASSEPPGWMLRGNLTARTAFRTTGDKTAFNADLAIEQFGAVHTSGKKLEDASVRLVGQGVYDSAENAILIEGAQLESGLLGADTKGKVALDGPAPRLDLEGQYRYDLVRISELARVYLGLPLYAAGRDTGPFFFHGPMSLAQAEAGLDMKWSGAEIVGFVIGPGDLKARLAGGTAVTEPLSLDVSEGRVDLRPRVTFSPEGSVLQVEPGRVADRIRISPQMCAGALQYIAPPLAGVATAEGTFSIEMDQCRIPLDAPEKGDLSGRMTVHAVSIGPGPLIRELAAALGFGRTAQLSRESTVPFRMVEGRVYHRDLQLVFPEVTMKTYGSVGLDQSLALIVEMPIPDKWRTGNPAIDAAVKNQSLRLPIGGSLLEPTVDRRELERQAGQFMQGAVGNVLQDQLNRQLERLLKPK